MTCFGSPERVTNPLTGAELALVIRAGFGQSGINFVTSDESVHQLGVIKWPRGHVIVAHVHNKMTRTIDSTQEVLFIREGRVRVDLYSEDRQFCSSLELGGGDVIFLVSGGHGFEILEDADIVEVKQGPYMGEVEKTRFSPTDNPHWIS